MGQSIDVKKEKKRHESEESEEFESGCGNLMCYFLRLDVIWMVLFNL